MSALGDDKGADLPQDVLLLDERTTDEKRGGEEELLTAVPATPPTTLFAQVLELCSHLRVSNKNADTSTAVKHDLSSQLSPGGNPVAMTYFTAVDSVAPTSASISHYYSTTVKKTEDLQTNACCTAEQAPPKLRAAMRKIHPDVLARYYGCGLVVPDCVEGLRVLDLGCGAGRDVYVLSQFVGSSGTVVGADFTPELLAVAQNTLQYHAEQFGYGNVSFLQSYIERLDALPSSSFDIIVSNCVVNLSPNKRAVLKEAYRLLKPGGEMYFSDVYSSARQSMKAKLDPVLWGECLSGALYWNDFLRLSKECGFLDPRLVKDSVITIANPAVEEKLGPIDFFSATYRLFKLPDLEPDCEDYGQAVIYLGTIEGLEHWFDLDGHHRIFKGKVFPVCGNTWRMLHDTRFSAHFEFIGNFDRHYGIFKGCGKNMPFASAGGVGGGKSCSSGGSSSCR